MLLAYAGCYTQFRAISTSAEKGFLRKDWTQQKHSEERLHFASGAERNKTEGRWSSHSKKAEKEKRKEQTEKTVSKKKGLS